MEIASLCRSNVITVREHDELVTAAELMRSRHVGYLVVIKPGIADVAPELAGVLTDRDIVVKVVSAGADPRTLTVGDVMTRDPVVVLDTEPLSKALGEMRRIGCRRLPVVGVSGQLVGVLSIDDVVDALAEELGAIAGSIRNELRIEAALHQ